MDYTESEEGQHAITQAEQDEKGQSDTEAMLAEYREVRERMVALTQILFPDGARICPIGCKAPNWRGTVRALDEFGRRDKSADTVWVDWDNGNKHQVKIDEIELVR